MSLKYIAVATEHVQQMRNGNADTNGQPAKVVVSGGDGNPCRHCLAELAGSARMLILAQRPFTTLQPYAEVGPVFLCGQNCRR